MNDAREGIVRLELPDGRTVALQLTYARLDIRGHGWVIEQLEQVSRAKAGADKAIADLLDVFSGGEVKAEDIMSAAAATYPIGVCTPALWRAWELAYYGPGGRPAKEGAANPQQSRPPTWWRRFSGSRSGQA